MKKLMHFFTLVWKVSPGYIFLLLASALTDGAKLFLNVILPKYLIDELLGEKEVETLIFFGTLIVINNVGMTLLSNTWKCIMTKKETYVKHTMNKIMAEKIMNLEYSYLEDPYYLDLKERAVFSINNQDAVATMITSVSKACSGFVTLAGLITIMATLGPVLLIILAVGIVAMLLISSGLSKYFVKMNQELIPINRRFGYYLNLGWDKQCQKDIRLYDMEEMIENRLRTYTDETCDLFEKIFTKMGSTSGGLSVINDGIAAISYGYVGMRTISTVFGPKISIGSLTMYVSAAINFSASVMDFGQSVISIMQSLAFLDPYMEFMSLEE